MPTSPINLSPLYYPPSRERLPAAKPSSRPSPSDEELVRRLQADELAAADELATRYREALVRYCFSHLGTLADAEDAAQDVLATLATLAARKGTDGLPTGPFRPWIYRVARNRCLDLLKRRADGRAGAGSFVRDSRWPSPRTGPRTRLLRDEQQDRLRELLGSIPDHHREVLVLRYFEDLKRQEIAQILDLPESVVKSRLFKARLHLKKRMAEQKEWSR